jgi:hypothetical protein
VARAYLGTPVREQGTATKDLLIPRKYLRGLLEFDGVAAN